MPIEIIIPIFIFISGIGAGIFFNIAKLKPLLELKKSGIIALAKITNKYGEDLATHDYNMLAYEFADFKGQKFTGKSTIAAKLYNSVAENSEIEIKYLKSKPAINSLPDKIDGKIKIMKLITYILYSEGVIIAPIVYFILVGFLK